MLGAPAARVAGVNLRVEIPRPRRGPAIDEGGAEMTEPAKAAKAAKPAASKPAGSRKPKTTRPQPDQDEISTRAYFVHLEEGGCGQLANWLRAERELTAA
jgi:hypothetical protein